MPAKKPEVDEIDVSLAEDMDKELTPEEKAAKEKAAAAEQAAAEKRAAEKQKAGIKDYKLKFNLRVKGRLIKAGTRLELKDDEAAEYPKGVLMPLEMVETAVDAG